MEAKKQLKHWTRKEKNKVRELFLVNKSDIEIANELGRTDKAIQQKRSKLGIIKRKMKKQSLPKTIPAKNNPHKLEDLEITLKVLKQLGYKLTITAINR